MVQRKRVSVRRREQQRDDFTATDYHPVAQPQACRTRSRFRRSMNCGCAFRDLPVSVWVGCCRQTSANEKGREGMCGTELRNPEFQGTRSRRRGCAPSATESPRSVRCGPRTSRPHGQTRRKDTRWRAPASPAHDPLAGLSVVCGSLAPHHLRLFEMTGVHLGDTTFVDFDISNGSRIFSSSDQIRIQ